MTLYHYKSIEIITSFLFSVFLALSVLTSSGFVVKATPEVDLDDCEADPESFGCPGAGAEGDGGDSSSSEDPLQSQQQQQQTPITSQQAQTFLTFEHPLHEYIIQYPSDWQKIEEEEQVRFVAPHKPGDEYFEAVTIGGITRTGTLGGFAASEMREISLSSNDFNLVESEDTKVGGRDAIKSIYTSATEDGREVKAMKNFLVIGGIGIEISYYAAEDEYLDSLAEAERMIDSFQIIKRDTATTSTGSSIEVQEQEQPQSQPQEISCVDVPFYMTCEGQTATTQQSPDDSLQQQQPTTQTDQPSPSDTPTPPSSASTDTPTTLTTATTTSSSGPNTITILERGMEVDPPSLTVTKGETIEVINKHSSLSTITSGSDGNHDGKFDTGLIPAGGSSSISTTNLEPGEHSFFSSLNPSLQGTIIVEEAPSPTSAADSTDTTTTTDTMPTDEDPTTPSFIPDGSSQGQEIGPTTTTTPEMETPTLPSSASTLTTESSSTPDTESQFSNKFGLDGSQNVNLENGVSYPIKYRITDGQVIGMSLESTSDGKPSLIIEIVPVSEAYEGKILLEIPSRVLDLNKISAVYDGNGLTEWKELARDSQAVVLEAAFFFLSTSTTIEIVGQQSKPQPSPQPSPDSSTPDASFQGQEVGPTTTTEMDASPSIPQQQPQESTDDSLQQQPQETFFESAVQTSNESSVTQSQQQQQPLTTSIPDTTMTVQQQQEQEQISQEAPIETPSLQSEQESLPLTSEPTSGTSSLPHVTSGMQMYENATLRFSIQHPSNSSVTERGDIVAFSLPQPSSYLLVRVSNLTTPGMSLENYSSVTINALSESRSGFSIEQQFNYSMLAGNLAHTIIYTENQNDSQRKTLQTWTVANGKSSDLTYVTDSANFDTGMPLAQRMIDSFQILRQDDDDVRTSSSVEGTTIDDTDTQQLSTITADLDNQNQQLQLQQQELFNDTSIPADTDTTINSTNPALAQGQPASIVINLTGDEIVPPISTDATGVAEFIPQEEDSILYTVNATNIEGVAGGHIHIGSEYESGPVVVTLFEYDDPVNEVRENGTITADKLEGPLAGKPLSELVLAEPGLYVNIKTEGNPNGEIRGQSGNSSP